MWGATKRRAAALLAWFHHHKWEDKKVNVYGIAFEQQCKCGAIRTTDVDGFDWNTCETKWTYQETQQ